MNEKPYDLAESLRLAEAREVLLDQFRQMERTTMIMKLASSIAHELGTPLNVISGRAMMIASGEAAGEESVACAQVIVEQAKRMTTIIRQILANARRQAGGRTPVEVRALFEKAKTLVERRARAANVEIVVESSSDEIRLMMDQGKFLQVLGVFLTNAIEAMPNGGTIRMGVSREKGVTHDDPMRTNEDYFCIYVKDEGIGIDKGDIPNVFKPFFKTNDRSPGTGLGLSIAHGIVREHGGWIDVESEVSVGSTFRVCLPEGGVKCRDES